MYENYSVLMSLYIKENPIHFKQSVESMLNQTILPEEIIIVLDGPLTPELHKLVDYYKDNHSELFSIIPLKNNGGLGNALNIGIKASRNELIARMDTDDISLPSRCEKQLKFFEKNPKIDIIGTQINEFYKDPSEVVSSRVVPTNHREIKAFARRRSPFNHPTVMYKKSVLLELGGYGKSKRKEDLDLFSRLLNEGFKSANLDDSLLLYRSDEDNMDRRKSWANCSDYIQAQYLIWKRGHCKFNDVIFVIASQIFFLLAPKIIVEKVSNKYLRKKL